MEEEEIYIDLFDQYNRKEIDHSTMADSLEEMDVDSDIDFELQCYQTAIILLEQDYIKDLIHKAEAEYLGLKKSENRRLWNIPLIL